MLRVWESKEFDAIIVCCKPFDLCFWLGSKVNILHIYSILFWLGFRKEVLK